MAALWKNQGIELDEYPQLKAWFDGIAARPAVQRGVEVLAGLRKPLAPTRSARCCSARRSTSGAEARTPGATPDAAVVEDPCVQSRPFGA